MKNEQLEEWTKTTAPGQEGCEIQPKDAKKLAKKIKKKKITGEQLSSMGEAQIGQLFPSGWNIAVVAEFSKAIMKTKQDEIDKNQTVSQTFIVNVGGMGDGKNKTIKVDKNWTYQRFLEALYEAEIGELPLDPTKRENKIKDFNVTGTKLPTSKHDRKTKTLEQLGWNRGHSIYATYTTQKKTFPEFKSNNSEHEMSSIFEMTTEELAEWAQTTLAYGQQGCEIAPTDAKKLAKRIRKMKITGKQLSNMNEAQIGQLFVQGWNTNVVSEFAKAVMATKQKDIDNSIPSGQGENPTLPQNFTVNVGGIGTGTNVTITVDKDWTFQRFKEALYEAEIGELPLDPTKRENKIKDFNVTGTKLPTSKHDRKTKTLEQ
eukprot:192660_1